MKKNILIFIITLLLSSCSTGNFFNENPVEEKWRLLALIQSYTGLSWIEFGKEDVFDIKTMIGGSALINRRVKQKKEYVVFLNKKVVNLIRDIGELPFKPYVFDLKYNDNDSAKNYYHYNNSTDKKKGQKSDY